VGEWNTARLTEDSVTFAFDGDADLERLIRFLGPVLIRPLNRRWEAKKLIISAPNGVDEQRYVRIGGIDQWMTIRGESRDNPALLFLHGGPGAGHTMFNSLTRAWERHFTIVQWDQRGSGKTRRKNGPLVARELTLMRLEEDGLQVVDYVRSYLNQEKIVLVASSVGSTFGLAMAKRRPHLFVAYVGTDQNTSPDAQGLSYQLTLTWLRESGQWRGVRAVERIGPDHARWTRAEFDAFTRWAIKANPRIPDMVMDVIFPALMSSPAHTMRDMRDLSAGIAQSLEQLYDELVSFDARKLGMEFELPFFIFQGDTDAVTPTAKAKEYFDEIRAPHKQIILIRNSGHLAAFSRPEQFLDELVQHVRPFARSK
jgi:pimeloyl-ACP methyl ester carboxylesterase